MEICSIIVTYNPDFNKILGLVNSLNASGVNSVIIVDNNSNNFESIKVGLRDFNFLDFICLNENFGIAFAQNLGIKHAVSLNKKYVIFFDQDSSIENNFINYLYTDFLNINDSQVSAIGPRFIDEKQNFYFPALRFNKYGLIDKIDVSNIEEPFEVSFLISSGTLVSINALQEIGLMKEEFFIDFVDTEWCFRALSKGYKLYMSKNAVMKHSIGDDTIKFLNFNIPVHSGFRRYYRIRNLFFMWKMPYIPKILVLKLMITNFIIQILLLLFNNKKLDYVKFYFKAIKDGILQSKDYQI